MMQTVPILKIIDIVKLNRVDFKFNTTNKSCIVLSCRTKGKSLFFNKNNTYYINRGDILYIPLGCSYKQESNNEEVIYFHLESYTDLCTKIKLQKTDYPDYICSLFEKCYDLYLKKETNYEYYCMSILYEILSHINITENTNEQSIVPVFDSAKKYIDAHIFDTNFTIQDLCNNSYISRTYFNKIFKKFFNSTPSHYINKKRIEKAKIFLDSGNYSNEEIAFLCGFSDVKYFYVVFKKITGQTTREYKNKEQSTR